MNTEPCEHCGDPAADALLRSVQLRVDGDEVDEQTLCPDCFSDWIARYQEEMATDMPGGSSEPETTDGDIRIAEEDERVRSHQVADYSEEHPSEAVGGTGDEIHDLGAGTNSAGSEDVAVDLDGETAVTDDEDDDGDSLLLD